MKIRIASIEKETDKALYVKVVYSNLDRISTWCTWLPKSRISAIEDEHIEVEGWLINRMVEDMKRCDNRLISQNARIGNIHFDAESVMG